MKVVVGDGNPTDLAIISVALKHAGYDVVSLSGSPEVFDAVVACRPRLLVVSGDLDGESAEFCRALRARSSVALMVLGTRHGEDEQVRVLDAGADDYLVKPFSPAALVARARALIRRSPDPSPSGHVEFGDLALDVDEHVLRLRDAASLRLTEHEVHLLGALMERNGRPVTDERLATAIWGTAAGDRHQALKQLVYRLRKKLVTAGSVVSIGRSGAAGAYRVELGDATSEPELE